MLHGKSRDVLPHVLHPLTIPRWHTPLCLYVPDPLAQANALSKHSHETRVHLVNLLP